MRKTERKHTILIVDDAEINRSMLTDMLSEEYEILEAVDGLEAVSVIRKQQERISLVLLDIVMPRMGGFDVLSIMGKSEKMSEIPVIMISAETSSSSIDKAYDLGAVDYISRPFDEKTVQRRAKNTIMLFAKQKMLEEMVTAQILEKEHDNSLMVEILSNIMEFRNGESGPHVLHIRGITNLLLNRLARMTDKYFLSARQIATVVNASALHDIGKVSISEEILNKPGRLTPEERAIMQTHAAIGAKILESSPDWQDEELVRVAHDICRWHHERWDGKGYPDGLVGDECPIFAQVVAMADVYDALTSVRAYKPAYSHEAAMRMILNGECGQFNPLLLQCLVEIGPRVADEGAKNIAEIISAPGSDTIPIQLPGGKASSRTLALLEQERTKYQFFASMTKEIQFEYNESADLLTISEWGAAQLGLSEVILHPHENEELKKVINGEDLDDLFKQLRRVKPDNPVVQDNYELTIRGRKVWYKAVARPLWTGEEHPVLTGTIGKFIDVHEEHTQLESLRRRAEQDSLTKLYNHAYARESIEITLAENGRSKGALILLDLDFFKKANDQFGHMFGDKVLKEVARRIVDNIRKGDIAARIGGDEFLIYASYEKDAETIVQRLLHAVEGEYEGFDISLSMGVARCPEDGENYETLFHCADQALYAAKKRGRRQHCFYSPAVRGTFSVLSPMERSLSGVEN